MSRLTTLASVSVSLALTTTLAACMADEEIEDAEDAGFANGKADGGIEEGSPEALGVLALVNDPAESATALKADAHVTTRVARNIVGHRDGADGAPGTADDDRFDSLAELDAIPFVGPKTLAALVAAARDKGLIHAGATMSVIFSPQPAAVSSSAKIAELIRGAQHTVDIAIYSFSDAAISAALAEAVQRGVQVRFLFETANEDRKITDPVALAASKSGRLEAAGIDVRWVNQILHHKVLIVDGPRDDKSLAATTKVVQGSANWNSTGASVFDETTIVIENSAELAAAYQHEFDILWTGSRELAAGAPAQPRSTANITTADTQDDPEVEAIFTSANFTPTGADGTTWRVDRTKLTMADAWVAAIQNAQSSIHIASGHLRLRPVVEALIAKKQAQPDIDIKLYLDQQEYISASGDAFQKSELEDCLAAATSEAQRLDCLDSDFLFSKTAVDAGIDVRFKSYAYRWDHSYAVQMHSKYMIVDGKELITGSYNLSLNAEQSTFENAIHIAGPTFQPIVAAFEQNFATIYETARAQDLLSALRTKISNDPIIPMVFDSMALTWAEFDALRTLIRANCTLADSTEFRSNPAAHKTCTRQ
jgi:phosphatidylserine/phosphatidylglycerophosphate/cardiolipin synthase-like enzyme